jgi:hypothetical protein
MPPRKICLQSSEMFNTPGMLRYARNAFRSPDKMDREVAIRMLVDGYGLPRFVAWGLLDGCIPHTIEGESVLFDVDTAPRGAERKAEIDGEELGGLLERWDEGDHKYVAEYLADASPSILAQFVKDLCDYDRGRNIRDFTSPSSASTFIHLLEGLEE